MLIGSTSKRGVLSAVIMLARPVLVAPRTRSAGCANGRKVLPGHPRLEKGRSGLLQSCHFVAAERRAIGARSAVRTIIVVPGDGRDGPLIATNRRFTQNIAHERHSLSVPLDNDVSKETAASSGIAAMMNNVGRTRYACYQLSRFQTFLTGSGRDYVFSWASMLRAWCCLY